MTTKQLQNSLSNWFRRTAGGDRRPVMFDIDQTYPTLRRLDRAHPSIRSEVVDVLKDRDFLPAYHDLDPDQADISAAPAKAGADGTKQWKVFYLWAMGDRAEQNAERCPITTAVLASIPNVFQAFFSILEPGKSVPEHNGPYCGYLRYHLGLVVSDECPPSIRVRDQHYTWREGESVLFDDSWNHEVTNDCPEQRVVLIVDVLRPMPLPQHLANRGAMLAAKYTYGRKVLKRAAAASVAEPSRSA